MENIHGRSEYTYRLVHYTPLQSSLSKIRHLHRLSRDDPECLPGVRVHLVQESDYIFGIPGIFVNVGSQSDT